MDNANVEKMTLKATFSSTAKIASSGNVAIKNASIAILKPRTRRDCEITELAENSNKIRELFCPAPFFANWRQQATKLKNAMKM